MGNTVETFAALIAFVGFGGLITLGGFVWKLADRLRAIESDASTARTKAESASLEARRVEQRMQEFQLDAQRRFVTDEMLTKLEERVIGAIERLGDRLDRVIEGRAVEPTNRRRQS